jgi:hypothetical protein
MRRSAVSLPARADAVVFAAPGLAPALLAASPILAMAAPFSRLRRDALLGVVIVDMKKLREK